MSRWRQFPWTPERVPVPCRDALVWYQQDRLGVWTIHARGCHVASRTDEAEAKRVAEEIAFSVDEGDC